MSARQRKRPAGRPGAGYVKAFGRLHQRAANYSRPSPAAQLLPLLSGVRSTGDGRWIARCPAHDDKRPSLSIREIDDGTLLLHCFAGCDALSIVQAVGLTLADLFPDGRESYSSPARPRIPAADILKCLGHEAMIIAVAAVTLRDGDPLSSEDVDRVELAAQRIQAALDQGGIRHAA